MSSHFYICRMHHTLKIRKLKGPLKGEAVYGRIRVVEAAVKAR